MDKIAESVRLVTSNSPALFFAGEATTRVRFMNRANSAVISSVQAGDVTV